MGMPLRYHLDGAGNGDHHPLLQSCHRDHWNPAQGAEHQRRHPMREGGDAGRDSCDEDGGPAGQRDHRQ